MRGSFGLTGIEPVDPAEAFPDSLVSSPISASNTGDVNAINIHNNSIVMGKDWCAISVGFILSREVINLINECACSEKGASFCVMLGRLFGPN